MLCGRTDGRALLAFLVGSIFPISGEGRGWEGHGVEAASVGFAEECEMVPECYDSWELTTAEGGCDMILVDRVRRRGTHGRVGGVWREGLISEAGPPGSSSDPSRHVMRTSLR